MKLKDLTAEKQDLLNKFGKIMSEANYADDYQVFDNQQDYPTSEFLAYGMEDANGYCYDHDLEDVIELAMALTARINYMNRVVRYAEGKFNEDGEYYHPGFDDESLGQGYFDHNGLRVRDCDLDQEHIDDLEEVMHEIDSYLYNIEINGENLSERDEANLVFYFDYSRLVSEIYDCITKIEDLMPQGGYCETPSPLEADFSDLDNRFDWEGCRETIELYEQLPELSTEVEEQEWER